MTPPPNYATYHRRKADLHELIAQSIERKQAWTLMDGQHPILQYKTEAPLHQFDGEIRVAPIWLIAMYCRVSNDSDLEMWRGYLFIDKSTPSKYPRYDITSANMTIHEAELEDMRLDGFKPKHVLQYEERRQQAAQGIRW